MSDEESSDKPDDVKIPKRGLTKRPADCKRCLGEKCKYYTDCDGGNLTPR